MRTAPILPLEDVAAPRSRWDVFFEVTLGALLAFMPFALGAVEAWSELVVTAAAAVLAMGLAVRAVLDRTFRPGWTWAYVPLALFLLLGMLQLVPLPPSVAEALSPPTSTLRKELLGADATISNSTPISLYTLATAHGLRMVLIGVTVFITVASVFSTPVQIKRLLWWVLAVGCAQAILALVQIFTFADQIHWSIETPTGRVTSGSFFNYSNFSQFMNLSIGAGVALLLVRLLEERRGAVSLTALQTHGGLMVALVVCAVSVFTSMSRMGAISLLAAAAVIGTALFLRGTLSRRGWMLAMAPIGTLAVVLAFAFDAVYERIASLQHETGFADRWELTKGVLRAWREFPVWGSGLGTHEFAFPMFDPTAAPIIAEHADNDYAQLLEETGVVGAALVGVFLLTILGLLIKLCRRGRTPLSAAAFGLAFGMLAVALHSATDFGQHLPAVFCLSAVTCGLIVQLARWERASAGEKSPLDRPMLRRAAGGAAAVIVALVGAWALRGAWNAYRGEAWRGAALAFDQRAQQSVEAGASDEQVDEDYADLLAASEEAVKSESGNVVYGYWLNMYRWQSAIRDAETSTGERVLPAEALPAVAEIADSLTAVRRLCPTYGPPYALEGQLRLTALQEERGRELIRTGVRLAPYDPPACMTAGEIAAKEGRAEEAEALLNRAVKLQPGYFPEAAALLMVQLDRPDLAETMAGDDYARLSELAAISGTTANYSMLKEKYRDAAETALRKQAAAADATPPELAAHAAIEARDGRHDAAIALYRRALGADYKQVQWRMALARSLVAKGRPEEALHEAQICLRLRPEYFEAKQLIDELGASSEKP
jgi:O-antigen ligase/tetratricopeptide (TPR) repeat protein